MPISDRFPFVTSRARLLAVAPLTCLLLAQPLAAQAPSRLAQAEMERRATRTREAQELLTKGDEAYKAEKWAEAAEIYGRARGLLPAAPASGDLRSAATERFAQASVEQARKQRRLGDVEGAKATLDGVLTPDVAPHDAAALQLQEELNDPIRTNPAVTLEHTKNVEKVRQLLYEAQGFKDLGKYDSAGMMYEDVLRLDPTNKAARRGMEEIEQLRADYYRAAYDETRADMLAQVDGAWELKVKPLSGVPGELSPFDGGPGAGSMLLSAKLDRLIVPIIDFDGTTIQEALDFLRAQSVKLDTFEPEPTKKGINFVLDLGSSDSPEAKEIFAAKINLKLRNVPISRVLQSIGEITRTSYTPQEYAVAIRPTGVASAEMITRVYRVPPDFLSSGGSAAGGEGALDPFADDKMGKGTVLTKKMDAETRLKEMGVQFPQGASASYTPGNSSLRVTNTVQNQELVQQVVALAASAKPTMVAVTVTMIKTQERTLKELDFDWLLDEFPLGGKGLVPGVPALHLSGGTSNPENLSDVALMPGEVFRHGITSGNRSGTEVITGNAIDDRITMAQQGFAPGAKRAPGVLWANGIINNNNLTMLMRGLDQKKGVDFVTKPTTVTRSGQQSTVEVIREFIYPEEYEPPELPNSVGGGDTLIDGNGNVVAATSRPLTPITPATPTSFTKRDVGVVLDVLPTVSADGNLVDLVLKSSVVDFDGFVNYGTPITSPSTDAFGATQNLVLTPNSILMPVFSALKADTSLTIQNGATIVFGGLQEERVQKFEDKTKFLGDLPLFGRFFRNEGYQPVRTAVIFLVTVQVLDPTGESPAAAGLSPEGEISGAR